MLENDTNANAMLLEVWEEMRPPEADELRFMLLGANGCFAGQYTCSLDSHGDRFFVMQESPRTKEWSSFSILAKHLDSPDEDLPKTTVAGRNLYLETVENPAYRMDL